MTFYELLNTLIPEKYGDSPLLEKRREKKIKNQISKKVITTCTMDCGGTCPLLVHVEKGVITKIMPYDDGKKPPLSPCIRGLKYHLKVYAPDRIKYPLIRIGPRGKGRFRRVEWDHALEIISKKMKSIVEKYGPEAIFECTGAGSILTYLHSTEKGYISRLINQLGGRTAYGTNTSLEGALWASRFTYGITSGEDANSFSDLINSKLIILWGFNPAENRFGTDSMFWLKKAIDSGVKIVVVDPCRTDTVNVLNAEWIPIRPSTDTAMLISMAYVLIKENLLDRDFIDQFVFGFHQYRDYLTGTTDGIPKTPEWAEKICGVSGERIVKLAVTYATNKPAALIQGWAPGRTANGEQYHRAAIALQALSGNIGMSGGSGSCSGLLFKGSTHGPNLHSLISEQIHPSRSNLNRGGQGVEISSGKWADAISKGISGGYPSDIKMIYVVGHNVLNQRQNVKKGIDAFKKVEFIVCQEQFLTTTARYSDIVLPVNTNFERNDISIPWVKGYYVIYANKVIDSLWESLSDYEIAVRLAEKLGIMDFEKRTEDELLKDLFDKSSLKDLISYDELKERGVLRLEEEPRIAFAEQITELEKNPFPTPSGKIEIFSQTLEQMNFDVHNTSSVVPEYQNIPKIPSFILCDELPMSKRAKKYPLQLTTPHSRYRTHSQFYNIKGMRNMYKHEVWINSEDAKHRNIKEGEIVRIFNERGEILVAAKITDRMMPGVVRCHEGAWYDPDERGVDRGGCVNVLIDDMLTSPGGASNCNTCLVEIQKEGEVG